MAGRRGGKTVWEIAEVGVTCVEDAGLCGWGAPNFPVLRDAWRDLKAQFAPFIREVRESEWTINFKSGGRLECWSLDSGIVARGRKYHKFIVDEAGLIANLALRFDAEIEPTLGDYDGTLIAGSTPNLVGPDFLNWFNLGQREGTGWKSWRWSSLDNPAVRDNMAKLIDAARLRGVPDWLIQQEYFAHPAESDRAFFRSTDLALHKAKHSKDPIRRGRLDVHPDWRHEREAMVRNGRKDRLQFIDDPSGPLKIWEMPSIRETACGGADLGYGVGSSNTTFSLGIRNGRRKVAEYAWPGVTPDEAAILFAMLGIWYRDSTDQDAWCCFERNGPGEMFAKKMHDLQYAALWFERRDPSSTSYNAITQKYGWNSGKDDKEYVLGNYRAALINETFINPSAAALDECPSYQYDDAMRVTSQFDRTKAKDDPARVKHGDRVIADALLNLCFDWTPPGGDAGTRRFRGGTFGDLMGLAESMPEVYGNREGDAKWH